MTKQLLLGLAAACLVLGACGSSESEKKDECTTSADCLDGQICVDGACRPDDVTIPCDGACTGATPICDEASNTCKACTATTGCTGGTPICDTSANGGVGACVACLGTSDCTSPSVCDTTTHTCVGCTATEGCSGATPVCDDGTCVACTADAGCDAAQICDTSVQGGACVTCTATAGCDAGQVCDLSVVGGSCVTCLADGTGCSGATPVCDTNVPGGECVECGNDDDCDGAAICDTARKQCVTCNDANEGCRNPWPLCDVEANGGRGECVECLSDANCGGGYPICHPDRNSCVICVSNDNCGGTTPYCDTSSFVGACVACIDNSQCGGDTPVCDRDANNGAGACRACSAREGCGMGTFCSTADVPDGECVVCNETRGCRGATPVCDTSVPGGVCVTCEADGTGCSGATPVCDTAAANGAGACVTCTATAGCSGATPVCDTAAAAGAGACVGCLADGTGCVDPTPLCDVTAAAGLGACVTCTATTGCAEPAPVCDTTAAAGAGLCVDCVANADCAAPTALCDTASHQCVGCLTGADCSAAAPVCDATAKTCVVCNGTTGCSGATPLCDVAAASGAGACVECLGNANCLASETCDAGTCRLTASMQIEAVRAVAASATLSLPVTGAYVTYLRPGLSTSDPAGFFVQGERTGPAMLVMVDPATLTPAPLVGDKVSFTVTEKKVYGLATEAATITGWTVTSHGNDVTPFIQDLDAATDVITGLDGYEAELISIAGTLASNFGTAGVGHVSATFTTVGVPTANNNLKLRLAQTLRDSLDLTQGCSFNLIAGPMWRYQAGAQPSAYYASDLNGLTCPSPTTVSAAATAATTVTLTFDRALDPASVLANGSQFTFDNGLVASGAVANGKTVTVTTATQTTGTTYTVNVAATVHGLYGASVVAPAAPVTFTGYAAPAPAGLVINEVDYDMVGTGDNAEFVEIYNASSTPLSLANHSLVLVNGSNGTSYLTVVLSGTLAAGGYAVVCPSTMVASLPAGTVSFTFTGTSNMIQNGDPDAAVLFNTATQTIVDALSYDGTMSWIDGTVTRPLVSGVAATVGDSNTVQGSMCRSPNGSDTGNDATNWAFCATPTPGAANTL